MDADFNNGDDNCTLFQKSSHPGSITDDQVMRNATISCIGQKRVHSPSDKEKDEGLLEKRYILLIDGSDDDKEDNSPMLGVSTFNTSLLESQDTEEEKFSLKNEQFISNNHYSRSHYEEEKKTHDISDFMNERKSRKANETLMGEISSFKIKNNVPNDSNTRNSMLLGTRLCDRNENFVKTNVKTVSESEETMEESNSRTKTFHCINEFVASSDNDDTDCTIDYIEKGESISNNKQGSEVLKWLESQLIDESSSEMKDYRVERKYGEKDLTESEGEFSPYSSNENIMRDIKEEFEMERNLLSSYKTIKKKPVCRQKSTNRINPDFKKRDSLTKEFDEKYVSESVRDRSFDDLKYQKPSHSLYGIEKPIPTTLKKIAPRQVTGRNSSRDFRSRNSQESVNKQDAYKKPVLIAENSRNNIETVIDLTQNDDPCKHESNNSIMNETGMEIDKENEDSRVNVLHFMLLKEIWSDKCSNRRAFDSGKSDIEENEMFINLLKEFSTKKNSHKYIPQLPGIDKFLKAQDIHLDIFNYEGEIKEPNNLGDKLPLIEPREDFDQSNTPISRLDDEITSSKQLDKLLPETAICENANMKEDIEDELPLILKLERMNSESSDGGSNLARSIRKPNITVDLNSNGKVFAEREIADETYDQNDTDSFERVNSIMECSVNEKELLSNRLREVNDSSMKSEDQSLCYRWNFLKSRRLKQFKNPSLQPFVKLEKMNPGEHVHKKQEIKTAGSSDLIVEREKKNHQRNSENDRRMSQRIAAHQTPNNKNLNCEKSSSSVAERDQIESGNTKPIENEKIIIEKRSVGRPRKEKATLREEMSNSKRQTSSLERIDTSIEGTKESQEPFRPLKLIRVIGQNLVTPIGEFYGYETEKCRVQDLDTWRSITKAEKMISKIRNGGSETERAVERSNENEIANTGRKRRSKSLTDSKLCYVSIERVENSIEELENVGQMLNKSRKTDSTSTKMIKNHQKQAQRSSNMPTVQDDSKLDEDCIPSKRRRARRNSFKEKLEIDESSINSSATVETTSASEESTDEYSDEQGGPIRKKRVKSRRKERIEKEQETLDLKRGRKGQNQIRDIHYKDDVTRESSAPANSSVKLQRIRNRETISLGNDSQVLPSEGKKTRKLDYKEKRKTRVEIKRRDNILRKELYKLYFTNFLTSNRYKVKYKIVNPERAMFIGNMKNADEAESFVKSFEKFDCANYVRWKNSEKKRYLLHRTWYCGFNGNPKPDVIHQRLPCQARIQISIKNLHSSDYNAHVFIYMKHTHESRNRMENEEIKDGNKTKKQ